MIKDILELLRERLEGITDTRSQVDICRYFADVEFFGSKVSDYKWLSDYVPKKYHNYLIKDFLDVNPNKYSDLFFNWYSYDKYCWQLENFNVIMNNMELDNKSSLFADNIMEYIVRDDDFLNAGLALFHQDKEIQDAAKVYAKKRN